MLVALDSKKLLGFRLVNAAIQAKVGSKPVDAPSIIGGKVGAKPLPMPSIIGGKVGSKPSAGPAIG